jgi:hypothetical protein
MAGTFIDRTNPSFDNLGREVAGLNLRAWMVQLRTDLPIEPAMNAS